MNKPAKSSLHPDRSPFDSMLFGASFGMNEWKHQINVTHLGLILPIKIIRALADDLPVMTTLSDVRHFRGLDES